MFKKYLITYHAYAQIHFLLVKISRGSSQFRIHSRNEMTCWLAERHLLIFTLKPLIQYSNQILVMPFLPIHSFKFRCQKHGLPTFPRLSLRFSTQPHQKLLHYLDSFQYIFLHKLWLPFIIYWD